MIKKAIRIQNALERSIAEHTLIQKLLPSAIRKVAKSRGLRQQSALTTHVSSLSQEQLLRTLMVGTRRVMGCYKSKTWSRYTQENGGGCYSLFLIFA